MHNVTITSDHPQTTGCGFGFYQYEYKSFIRLTLTHSRIFVLIFRAVQHAVAKFLEERIASWCCFSNIKCPTDSCLLHSRQNLKQIVRMREINNLKWQQSIHRTLYILSLCLITYDQSVVCVWQNLCCICCNWISDAENLYYYSYKKKILKREKRLWRMTGRWGLEYASHIPNREVRPPPHTHVF